MEISSAFIRNLDPLPLTWSTGDWSAGCYVDHVSERRYLLWRKRSDKLSAVDHSTLVFRTATAGALSDGFVELVELAVAGNHTEFLTAFTEPVRADSLDDDTLRVLFEDVLDTLAQFERHAFYVSTFSLDSVGRLPTGRFVLTPLSVIDPPPPGQRGNLAALSQLIDAVIESSVPEGAFATRVRDLAEAILTNRANSLDEAANMLLDGTSPAGATTLIPGARSIRNDDARTREVRGLIETHSIVEIAGGPATGKSSALFALAAALSDAGEMSQRVDEWSFYQRARRRGAGARDTAPPPGVWLIDDIEEREAAYGEIFRHVSEDKDARVVWTRRPGRSEELPAFLQGIRHRAALGVATVSLETVDGSGARRRLAEMIRATGANAEDGASEEELLALLDESLAAEEKQILELATVAGTCLPLSLLDGVFGGVAEHFHLHLHRLAALGLIAIDYRTMPPDGKITATIRVSSGSLQRLMYKQISDDRRRNLHRTVSRLARSTPGFPPILVYRQLMVSGEDKEAALKAVDFLRETDREQRAPYLETLTRELVDEARLEALPYGDRLYVALRLGSDLLARGQHARAELLLEVAREMPSDTEEIRTNAALISETTRLLADAWAARSNYTAALELLHETRDVLNPYLPLADQAQLMNEIGWLQYRLGDYNRSIESCKLSLNTLNPNEHPLVVAQALNLLGVIHFNTSRYDEAISYYEQSAILRQKEDDRNALAGSYNNLALAYQAKGEYDKALSSYDKSLAIKKEQNNEAGIAAGYLNQALLYLEVHNFDEAERMCRASLEIASNLGIAQLTAENHSTLGDIAFTRGRFQEAEEAYRKSLALAQSLETTNEEMGARRRLAKLYLETDRLPEARELVEAAARLAEQIGSKYESALIESILGDLDLAEQRYSESIEHYEKAASLFAIVSKYRLAATALARIGQAHSKRGNSFEAKHYLDRATDVIQSTIGHEIPDDIVVLQQMLREHPLRPVAGPATDTQRLLYAFYELSSLSEFADDRTSFYKRIISVFTNITGADACRLALGIDGGGFVCVGENGDQQPIEDAGTRELCARALQLGSLLSSDSEEATDIPRRLDLPADKGVICIPMKSMGGNLGCVLADLPVATLPLSKEDTNFFSTVGRHVAGALRLTFHLEEHAHKEETLAKEFRSLKEQVVDQYRLGNLIGKDESMKKIFRMIDKIKDVDTGILIIGESGTGKTELARTVHYTSPRRKHNFQQIHCAEIPTNLLESELFGHERGAFTGAVSRKLGRCEVADRGTIFLDDVNVMPMETQAKLLHYLESKSFTRLGGTQRISTDVRIIAASNENLEMLVGQGRFREDLYYRLRVLQIELPPLNERPEDMTAIANAYLKRRCQEQQRPLKTLTTETIKLFRRYRWPGNVRELQNVLEQIVLLSDDDIVEPASLPEDFLKRAAGPERHSRQTLEALADQMVNTDDYSSGNPLMPQIEALLARKMADHMANKGKAASMLGITKPTLYNRLRGYDKLN